MVVTTKVLSCHRKVTSCRINAVLGRGIVTECSQILRVSKKYLRRGRYQLFCRCYHKSLLKDSDLMRLISFPFILYHFLIKPIRTWYICTNQCLIALRDRSLVSANDIWLVHLLLSSAWNIIVSYRWLKLWTHINLTCNFTEFPTQQKIGDELWWEMCHIHQPMLTLYR